MTATDLVELLLNLALWTCIAVVIFKFGRRRWNAKQAKSWPATEGTVETATFEKLVLDGVAVPIPAFGFSYRVGGRNYGGTFQLHPYSTDPFYSDPEFMKHMVGRKLKVHFNPEKPGTWFITEEYMEGCKVVK
jgi:hypothetical protein